MIDAFLKYGVTSLRYFTGKKITSKSDFCLQERETKEGKGKFFTHFLYGKEDLACN